MLSGLIGAAGPVNVIMLEKTKAEKNAFIGTFAASTVIMTITKIFNFNDSIYLSYRVLSCFSIGIDSYSFRGKTWIFYSLQDIYSKIQNFCHYVSYFFRVKIIHSKFTSFIGVTIEIII